MRHHIHWNKFVSNGIFQCWSHAKLQHLYAKDVPFKQIVETFDLLSSTQRKHYMDLVIHGSVNVTEFVSNDFQICSLNTGLKKSNASKFNVCVSAFQLQSKLSWVQLLTFHSCRTCKLSRCQLQSANTTLTLCRTMHAKIDGTHCWNKRVVETSNVDIASFQRIWGFFDNPIGISSIQWVPIERLSHFKCIAYSYWNRSSSVS